MSLSLEFFLNDGQVILYDSLSNPSANDADTIGMMSILDCSEMTEKGVAVSTWLMRAETDPACIEEDKVIVGPEDIRHTYKVLQNNRDFMLMGEEGYLLNPTETQMYLDDLAADAAAGPDDEHYAKIIAEQAARQAAGGTSHELSSRTEDSSAEDNEDGLSDPISEDETSSPLFDSINDIEGETEVSFDESSLF